jgi:hypothetical protein
MIRAAGGILAVMALLTSCVSPDMRRKAAIEEFLNKTSGEFHNDKGDLLITPVIARMVAYDTLYVEKRDTAGTVFSRLVALEYDPGTKKIVQRALAFTADGQWRNLRENPELFTALLPKDVRPAGSCNIDLAEDGNSVNYSCSGSPPETFNRRH